MAATKAVKVKSIHHQSFVWVLGSHGGGEGWLSYVVDGPCPAMQTAKATVPGSSAVYKIYACL